MKSGYLNSNENSPPVSNLQEDVQIADPKGNGEFTIYLIYEQLNPLLSNNFMVGCSYLKLCCPLQFFCEYIFGVQNLDPKNIYIYVP